MPPNIPSQLSDIITSCWKQEIDDRPNIVSVIDMFKPLEFKFMQEELRNRNQSLEKGRLLYQHLIL